MQTSSSKLSQLASLLASETPPSHSGVAATLSAYNQASLDNTLDDIAMSRFMPMPTPSGLIDAPLAIEFRERMWPTVVFAESLEAERWAEDRGYEAPLYALDPSVKLVHVIEVLRGCGMDYFISAHLAAQKIILAEQASDDDTADQDFNRDMVALTMLFEAAASE